MYYEVLWYKNENLENPTFKEFKTKKQALKFYEEHKKDTDKFGFWVTKRNEEGEVLKDLVY